MSYINFENEEQFHGLYSSSEFKKRNKRFGSKIDVNVKYPNSDTVLQKIFDVRASKTPGGCPFCGTPWFSFKRMRNKLAFRCKCGYKVHPLKGTHLEHLRTPLKEVLWLFYDLFSCKFGKPSLKVQREMKWTYDTCWKLQHKLSDWMGYSNEMQMFTPGSTIELDIVYPKATTFLGRKHKYKRGPWSERRFATLVISERDNPANNFYGVTKAYTFDKTDKKAVQDIFGRFFKPEHKHLFFTDEGKEFKFLSKNGFLQHHYEVNHSEKGEKGYANMQPHKINEGEFLNVSVNKVEGCNQKVKTSIHRIYLGVHPKYLQLYVNRVIFNFGNAEKDFFEAWALLLNALPGFTNSVPRTFIPAKRIDSFGRDDDDYTIETLSDAA